MLIVRDDSRLVGNLTLRAQLFARAESLNFFVDLSQARFYKWKSSPHLSGLAIFFPKRFDLGSVCVLSVCVSEMGTRSSAIW